MRQGPWKITRRMTALQLRALLTANWLCCKKFYARCLILCRRALRQCQMQHCHSLLIKACRSLIWNISFYFKNFDRFLRTRKKILNFRFRFFLQVSNFFCRNRKQIRIPIFLGNKFGSMKDFRFIVSSSPEFFLRRRQQQQQQRGTILGDPLQQILSFLVTSRLGLGPIVVEA